MQGRVHHISRNEAVLLFWVYRNVSLVDDRPMCRKIGRGRIEPLERSQSLIRLRAQFLALLCVEGPRHQQIFLHPALVAHNDREAGGSRQRFILKLERLFLARLAILNHVIIIQTRFGGGEGKRLGLAIRLVAHGFIHLLKCGSLENVVLSLVCERFLRHGGRLWRLSQVLVLLLRNGKIDHVIFEKKKKKKQLVEKEEEKRSIYHGTANLRPCRMRWWAV